MQRSVTLLGWMLLGGCLVAAGCAPSPQREDTLARLPAAEQILSIEAVGLRGEAAPPVLKRLLGDPSLVVRAQAAQLLAAVAADRGPGLALAALTHEDPLVRGIAQASYIEHHPYGMAPVVVDGRVAEDPPYVLEALARLGDPHGRVDLDEVIADHRATLREALEAEPETAVLAADILARIGDAGARRRLLLLAEEAEGQVLAKAVRAAVRHRMGLGPTLLPLACQRSLAGRRAAMRALVASPDPRLQMLLRRGLRDNDTAVRRNAIRAMGNLGAAAPVRLLAEFLERGDRGTTADALGALGVIGRPAEDVLREYIRTSGAGPELQVRAMMALAPNAGRQDIPWASARLASDDTYVRAAAASVLGRIGHPESQAALVEACDDPEPLVRAAVAKALGQVGTIYAANHLLDMLDDPSPLVASMAAWGLGATGWLDAAPALIEVCTSHDSSGGVPVRVGEMYARPELAATEALGRIRSEEGRQALRTALEADAWRIRAAACDALRIAADRSEESVAALEKRLDDPVRAVAAHALAALEALGKTYEPGAFQAE
ncbi:MAG: HEAT repeat domain-containing protein [Phycisphaerae bacterium]